MVRSQKGWNACFLGRAMFIKQNKDLRSVRPGSPQDWSPYLGIELAKVTQASMCSGTQAVATTPWPTTTAYIFNIGPACSRSQVPEGLIHCMRTSCRCTSRATEPSTASRWADPVVQVVDDRLILVDVVLVVEDRVAQQHDSHLCRFHGSRHRLAIRTAERGRSRICWRDQPHRTVTPGATRLDVATGLRNRHAQIERLRNNRDRQTTHDEIGVVSEFGSQSTTRASPQVKQHLTVAACAASHHGTYLATP